MRSWAAFGSAPADRPRADAVRLHWESRVLVEASRRVRAEFAAERQRSIAALEHTRRILASARGSA